MTSSSLKTRDDYEFVIKGVLSSRQWRECVCH